MSAWPGRLRNANSSVQRRSEEHTSELQSPCNLVCRLLLEKKKNMHNISSNLTHPFSNNRVYIKIYYNHPASFFCDPPDTHYGSLSQHHTLMIVSARYVHAT